MPWPQKGASVTLPLGTTAPVIGGSGLLASNTTSISTGADLGGGKKYIYGDSVGAGQGVTRQLFADLSQATAATINQLRQSFQIQKLLERDARGGTRYTEIIRAHFGVISPDARLQRPEYIGGGTSSININPIAQTSGTSASGTTTPLGTLAAMGTALAHNHGFTYSATEHGVILGLVAVRADLTYQQGLARMWSRSTRYDFYFPASIAINTVSIASSLLWILGAKPPSSPTFVLYPFFFNTVLRA